MEQKRGDIENRGRSLFTPLWPQLQQSQGHQHPTQRYIPLLSVPPMGILPPKRPCPQCQGPAGLPVGTMPSGRDPRGWRWHRHRPGIWPCFQLFRFLCGSWRVGGCQAEAFVPQEVLGLEWGWPSFLLSFFLSLWIKSRNSRLYTPAKVPQTERLRRGRHHTASVSSCARPRGGAGRHPPP